MELKEYDYFGERKRYRLIRRLGCGGFSEVWLAEDMRANNMEVALKVYASVGGLDEDGIQMFREEFALLFNMNHGNLLKPTHFDDYQQCPYLTMPFCKKGSAQKLVGSLNEKDAWRFLLDVASGLDYLHSLDPPVIHQDISTENILVNDQGDFLITDFGISTKARHTLRKSAINLTDSQEGGKVDFMAPELFGVKNKPIKASDIWALGVTMYELLEGRLPFPQGLGGLAQKGGADIPEINGKYSKELKNLVYKMLDNEPWNRPTAEVIKKQVEIHLKGSGGKTSIKLLITIASIAATVMIGLILLVVYLPKKKNKQDEILMILNHGVENMRVCLYDEKIYLRPTQGKLDTSLWYTPINDSILENIIALPDSLEFLLQMDSLPPRCIYYLYTGRMKNGYPDDTEGKADYDCGEDKHFYTGGFQEGLKNGRGERIYKDDNVHKDMKFDGTYRNNMPVFGTLTFKDYQDNDYKSHGRWKDERLYDGTIEINGKMTEERKEGISFKK